MRYILSAVNKWMLLLARLSLLSGMGLAVNAYAIINEAPPSYSISPSIHGLNLAYFAQQDKVKINLYIVNHEHFPVLCDSQYQGGPDTENTHEKTVMPEKAIAFTFSYPGKTKHVHIQLVCTKANVEYVPDNNAVTPDTNVAPEANSRKDPLPIIETDLTVKH